LINNSRHLRGKDQNNEGGGDCLYNSGNEQGNDSNNDGKNNLNSLLNGAIKIYNNPIYQRDLIRKVRKDKKGKIVYTLE